MPLVYSRKGATLLGGVAILLWSTVVALIRNITEALGAVGGAAMLYSVSTLFLLLLVGWPKLKLFPRKYVFYGGLLFAAYEVCLSLSLGYATNRAQSIELGMINYLWPCFTVMLAVAINRQSAGPAVFGGILLALFGVGWLMCGDGSWTPQQMWGNIQQNPLSYGLAFSGALIWAVYCNITRKYAQGRNGVTFFFLITALCLWLKYGLSHEASMHFDGASIVQLMITGAIMGTAYAAWNVGIMQGNMTLLATFSYFTPVLSAVFASIWLEVSLRPAFWQGVAMICLGSLICWWFTRNAE